jgi:hypothetical protein
MVQLQLSHVSESWSVLLLVILIIISDTAVNINQMNSMYDCRYCNSFSFKDNRALASHLRVRHFVAEEVNVKGVLPNSDMLLCKVCNIYLDPGVKFTESSHQFTGYHLRNMGVTSTQSIVQPPVIQQQIPETRTESYDDGDSFDGGGDGGDHLEDNETSERDALLHRDDLELLTGKHSPERPSTSTDWMLDRDEHFDATGYEDVVGWVWNCPFDNDRFPFAENEGGMAQAALDPENYARYRAVHVIVERDQFADIENEVRST